MPVCNFYPHFRATHCVTSNSGVLSNPALHERRSVGPEENGTMTAVVKIFQMNVRNLLHSWYA
jgi:hypothetical protein